MTHIISHEHLSLGRLKEIIENHERVELGPEAVAAIVAPAAAEETHAEDQLSD